MARERERERNCVRNEKMGKAWLSTGIGRFRAIRPVVGGMSITSGEGTWHPRTCEVL